MDAKAHAGNQALRRLLAAGVVKPKLAVSHPSDPEELEADRAANAFVAGAPLHRKCTACTEEDEEESNRIRRKALGPADHSTSMLRLARSPGEPLPRTARLEYERFFNADFGGVRIHTGPEAQTAARTLNALAFTTRRDIFFAPATFDPRSSDGRRLLAHELAHVAKPGRAQRAWRQRAEPAATPAPAPPKPGPEVEPRVSPETECRTVESYRFCADRPQVRFTVRKMVKERGLDGARDIVMRMLVVAQGGSSSPVGPGATMGARVQSPADVAARMRRNEPADLALAELHALSAWASTFRDQAGMTLTAVLRESEIAVETERTRYGVEGSGGQSGTYSMRDTESTKLMMAAAKDLLEKNKRVEELSGQQRRYVRPIAFAPPEVTNKAEYARLGAEIKKAQREYDELATAAKMRYPILAAVLESRGGTFGGLEAMDRLGKVAGGGKSGAGVIGWLLDERKTNIEKVRKEEGQIQPLKLPQIVGLTKLRLQVAADSPENKIVDDMVSSITWEGIIKQLALAVVALGLGLIAAIPSGGSSLVAAGTFVAALGAAGLSGYQLAQSIREYEIESAEARSDLDRARAVSSSEPALLWLALDIVGAIADLAAAAKAFKSLAVVVREALAAKTTSDMADSTRALRNVASAQEGATPALGERLVASVERMRDGGASGTVRSLGVAGAHEAEALEQITKQATKELGADSPKAVAAFGGEVKVSRSGWLFSCASPCSVLREKYAAQLATNTKLRDELAALESAAEKAAGNSSELQRVANEAATLEGKLRNVAVGGWESPLKARSDYPDLLKRRGSAAFELDRTPPGWTGRMEAEFRYGKQAEEGYRWVLQPDGTLRYDRLSRSLPERYFNIASGAFEDVPSRAAAIALESEEELAELAHLGKGAASRAEWLGKIRSGVPELKGLSDAQLSRVLAHSPNLDHMRGALLEELAGGAAGERAKSIGKGVEYISPDRIRDAAKAQLTDGMLVRKLPDGSYEVVAFIESKAGAASAEQLGASRKAFNKLSGNELEELEKEALEEFRVRKGLDPEATALPDWATSDKILKEHPDEIQALMRDIHSQDMGQIRKSFERLMPGVDDKPVKVFIERIGEVSVRVSPSKTKALAVTTTDVSTQRTATMLGGEGLKVEALDIGISGERLEGLARQLRAEAVKNAPPIAP